MNAPVLHIPLDFERHEDVRRLHRSLGMFDNKEVIPFRLWLDWGTVGCDFRPLKNEFKDAESYEWANDELTYIIEDFVALKNDQNIKPGDIIKAAIEAGMILVEELEGRFGLVLKDFARFNPHLLAGFKTMQQKGQIAQQARRTIVAVDEAAAQQVEILADRGAQFALPLNSKPTTEEVKACIALIMKIDIACQRPTRSSETYTKEEELMCTALQIVRRYSKDDIREVYEYVIANRDNPRLGKIPNRILERFDEHLRKAKDGCSVIA